MNELEPWQQQALDSIKQYKGKGFVQITGRNSGKSQMAAYSRMFNDIMNANIKVSDLILSEGSVFGAKFYTVEPVGGNWLDMELWCSQTFGPVSNIWDIKKDDYQVGRWYVNDRRLWFRNIKDRDWFILRWNS
jgi:hypothetical protein